jgi:hypothetical protein
LTFWNPGAVFGTGVSIEPSLNTRRIVNSDAPSNGSLKLLERLFVGLSTTDADTAGRISQLSRIVAFRNRIVHGYDTIDDATVWGIIDRHLSELLTTVEDLLSGSEAGGS